MNAVVCRREPALPVDEFGRVLVASGLGARRPADEPARLRQTLHGAALAMTARTPEGRMLGVRDELGPKVTLVLASVPDAVAFYAKVGMPRLPDAFFYRRAQ